MPSLTSRRGFFFTACLFAVTFPFGSSANITVNLPGEGEIKTIASTAKEQTVCASIRGLCDVLGFTCRFSKTAKKLTCVKGNRKIVFSEDVPFYYVNDTIRQIPSAPISEESVLYLPAWLAVSVLSDCVNKQMEWNDADSTITVSETAPDEIDSSEKPKKEPAKAPESSQAAVPAEPAGDRQLIKTIVIDPGHGGRDPGAIGQNGAREKDIVLSVGLKLRDMLKKKAVFYSFDA
jgi:N-acetylmuramoyl-L-alanine amidase